MASHDDVAALLAATPIVPSKIVRKPRAAGPKPVPEFDEHVLASYKSGEAFELTVEMTDEQVGQVKTLIRKSARYVGAQIGEDVRVTFKVIDAGKGKTTVQFRARPPLEMGRRAHRNRKNG